MPCGKWKVNFTRGRKRLQTSISFHKKPRASAYAKKLNKNLTGANARVVKSIKGYIKFKKREYKETHEHMTELRKIWEKEKIEKRQKRKLRKGRKK